ncbi:protein RALF-like 34 [Punica granatum]|uniref:Protein RALF-like 34 n=1 Tax=Punica granatum TaxID=22663 RepID=A0A218W0A9_PUNGR|nr:protein RALF-like 34 [Punica granatum]OWM66267.1 hypothetical protein CDL15_Pgr013484 [Punica granatum]
MASPPGLGLLRLSFLLSFLLLSLLASTPARAQILDDTRLTDSAALEWTGASLYGSEFDNIVGEDEEEEASGDAFARRSLYWRSPMRYYISYGALSANRIPCPPRSGRSYYTHNCFKARGPVHPYSHGCSAITRCRK